MAATTVAAETLTSASPGGAGLVPDVHSHVGATLAEGRRSRKAGQYAQRSDIASGMYRAALGRSTKALRRRVAM